MRVLMLGWEFPPFISGGLGTACHGLTRAMNRRQVDVLFVLPREIGASASAAGGASGEGAAGGRTGRSVSGRPAEGLERVRFRAVPSSLSDPYQAARHPRARREERAGPVAPLRALAKRRAGPASVRVVGTGAEGGYEGDLLGKIQDYAARCVRLAGDEPFDVIHAHDWMTFPAGRALAARSGKPLVVHVHSTEFDRSGDHVHQPVYDTEQGGMRAAAAVIAVSDFTKRIVVERYGVPAGKTEVVHNGLEWSDGAAAERPRRGAGDPKVVLFLGRITRQKGPEFFLAAAARVLERLHNVRFVVAGWGDLGPQIVERVAALGLGQKVLFAGFLKGKEVEHAFRMADVYVMPSVSEPFGLTALEAIQYGTPVILSKNSGVAEVLHRGALKVDFWDIDRMATQIVAVLRYPELAESLRRYGMEEVRGLTWDEAAGKCLSVYRRVAGWDAGPEAPEESGGLAVSAQT